jgi:hypothetical protein
MIIPPRGRSSPLGARGEVKNIGRFFSHWAVFSPTIFGYFFPWLRINFDKKMSGYILGVFYIKSDYYGQSCGFLDAPKSFGTVLIAPDFWYDRK